MSSNKKCKIAIAQVGTTLFDNENTLNRMRSYVCEAKKNSADLVLFPEAFIGGYPKLSSFGVVLGTRSDEGRKEYERYFNSAIEEYGPEHQLMANLAMTEGIHIVTGVVEKEDSSLFCSVFFFGPEGYIGKHQKLLPTAMERCIWSNGNANHMKVFSTGLGKIGAAVCWENYMPLYRYYLYSQGIEIYLAPTVDDRDVWLSTMRTIALEGRCYVVSACQFLKSSGYPENHEMRKAHGDDKVLIRGGSCAVDPLGNVLVEPDFSGETIKYVEVDLAMNIRGKFDLDSVGHYNRHDVFQLHVTKPNKQLKNGIVETESESG